MSHGALEQSPFTWTRNSALTLGLVALSTVETRSTHSQNALEPVFKRIEDRGDERSSSTQDVIRMLTIHPRGSACPDLACEGERPERGGFGVDHIRAHATPNATERCGMTHRTSVD